MEITKIAKIIEQNGGRLYLVGGAVRDKILIKNQKKEKIEDIINQNKDEDYCATGIESSTFQKLFPQATIRGKDFPVFDIEGKEFAIARIERKAGVGHKQFELEAGKHAKNNKYITIEEDLARRDITINAIAQDVLTGEIIDPFNGEKDIKEKVIRKVSEAFKEDPLRVYRVARFSATLGFTVEENTIKSIEQLKEELNTLSKERVFQEFKKALASNKPSIFFQVLKKANVLDVHFTEIANLIGKNEPEEYHPEGDSYNHTMIAVDNSAKLTNNLEVRFSCLVHDLGKGVTPEEILPHHYGHDEKGVEEVRKLSARIGLPIRWKKCGKTACRWHMKAGIFNQMTTAKKVELIEKVSKSILGLEGLKIVVACDKSREVVKADYENIKFASIGKKCIEEINGEYIKEKYPHLQGIKLGQKLHEERVRWLNLQKDIC